MAKAMEMTVITEGDKKLYNECLENITKMVNGVKASYIAIGVQLKRIREKKLYEIDNYKNVYDLANEKFGMSKTTASNAIKVCERFCKDGNLLPQYANYNFTQLTEMISMDEEQVKDVNSDMSAKKIREIKNSANGTEKKQEKNTEEKQEKNPEEKQEKMNPSNVEDPFPTIRISYKELETMRKVLYDKKVDKIIHALIENLEKTAGCYIIAEL